MAASYPIAKEIKGCNHLLFHKFIKKISSDKKNIRKIHLSGGTDKLKYFKTGFGQDKSNYFVIKNIINKNLYAKLLKTKISEINYDSFFPDKRIYNYNLSKTL